jgi:hypothetical protein
MNRIVIVFISLFFLIISVSAELKPLSIMPVSGPLSNFYKTEIIKIATYVVLKTQKHSLYLSASLNEEMNNNIDLIRMTFKRKNSKVVSLEFFYEKKKANRKRVALPNIAERNVLYYSRLALYHLLFGKNYVKKNSREIRDEDRKFSRQVSKRSSILDDMNKKVTLFDQGFIRRKKEEERVKKISENKERIRKEALKKRRSLAQNLSGKKLKSKNVNNKDNVDKNKLNSPLAKSSADIGEKDSKPFFRKPLKSSYSASFGQRMMNKTTQDFVTSSYQYQSVFLGGRYLMPIAHGDFAGFIGEAIFEQPISKSIVTSGTEDYQIAFERSLNFSVLYQNPIEELGVSSLLGFLYRKEQFINLPAFNAGVQVGIFKTLLLQAGLSKNLEGLFKKKSSLELTFSKVFFSKVDYGESEDYNIDGLLINTRFLLDVFKGYGLSFNAFLSSYSLREKTLFSDEGVGFDVALTMNI